MSSFDNEFNDFENEKPNRKKKPILIGIVICIILIVLLTILVIFFQEIDSKTFKLYVNEKRVKTSSDFYTEYEGKSYVKASEIAGLIGWTYQNGAYGEFSEDNTKGYFRNSYEAASIESDSNIIKKYTDVVETTTDEDDEKEEDTNTTGTLTENSNSITVYSENGTLETTKIDSPVIYLNNSLYIPFENLRDICNCSGSYKDYRMYVYDMQYLENKALTNAAEYGYKSVSGTYENLKALSYNMLVVLNNTGKYGVVTLSKSGDTPGGTQVLGFKYSDVVFCQNVQEFLVKADNTVGIVSSNGDVIISPKNYDDIKIISDELGLYLVKENNKYGVLNRNGDTVVYPDFDSIGLDDETVSVFNYGVDNNKYVLNNNLIVVESEGKYGLYNLEGNEALAVRYNGLGYINSNDEKTYDDNLSTQNSNSSNTSNTSNSSNTTNSSRNDDNETNSTNRSRRNTDENETGNSVLLIDLEYESENSEENEEQNSENSEEAENTEEQEQNNTNRFQGIVVSLDVNGEILYGIYDLNSQRLAIPCVYSRIYSVTRSGKTSYYMDFGGEEVDLEDYLKSM